ncbi:uncharacterized protein [Argopecten irradians]|uniref:uncharacterized protein isoform X2 n=1 Tax=Argopecten irradians TaxID=31199 RepID=UPI003713EAF6
MPATRNQSPQVKGRLTRNASPRQSDRNCQDIKARQTSPRGAGKAESITMPDVSGKGKNIEVHSRSSPRRMGKQEINDELPNKKSLKPQDTSIKFTRTRSSQGNNDTVKPKDIEKNENKDRSGRGLTRQEDANKPVADTKSKAASHPKKPSIREIKEVNSTENNPSTVSCEEPQPQSKRRVGRPTKAQKNQQIEEDDLSAKVTTKSEGTVQISKQAGKVKAYELLPADDNSVLKESTAEDSANRRGHKRRNDDHNNSTDKQETKRKKINEEFDVEIDGEKELGKTTLTAPSDDTFSPRRSGRGVVPNRRFKDMEMDFSPANKRRQSAADDGEKPKTSSTVKRKTKSKAKEKETIVEPAIVMVHKGDNESYSGNLKQKDTSTIHIDDNTGVLMDQTDHQDANLSVLVGRTDHQDMNPGVVVDRTDHQNMNPGVVVDGTDQQDMNPDVLVDKTDHQDMNTDVIVDRAVETEENQGVTEDHQDVVMESMENNWVEEEVVTADRELVIEHVGDETTTATFIAESESEEPDSAVNTENQNLHSLENTEQFDSEANIEDIARQTMTLLMRENHLGNSGANFVITPSSDAQIISDVEAIEETGQVKDLIEESEQGKDSVVIEATIENIRDISETTVNETMTTATEVTDTPDTDKQMAESGTLESDSTAITENNNTTTTENCSATVDGSKETEVNQTAEAVNNLEGYKVMKLEDVVHELRGNSKDSQITATRVTNVEKDVDEDIIRKILLSNKTFTDTDEIEIQFIGGEDSHNEVDEANILSEKIIAMRNITKSNMSSSATQTPIISSRVANLPGKGKTATTLPEPSRMKTIRVNIQRPDGIEETKELQTEEGKAQEFVIVHLPEGTKVTRPKVKQDKTEETVPFSLNDEGDFVCGVCEYTTPKKANWYKHKKKHMAQKPHCCEKCGYQASTSSNLKRHLAIHDDIRDFQCSYCFMTFRQKIHLERHVKYRHEVKKVKCPLCDYVCANENPDLKVHIKRRHLPQDSEDGSLRAFACDECGAMAVNKKDLKQHMKFHRKGPELKLYCEHCSFVTDCESRLRRHMFIHTNEKPFQCGLCAYRGTQKEHVLRHMKSQHNIDIHKKGRTLEELSADGSTDSRELLLDKKPYKTDYSSQEKIFACNHCSMKFAKLLNLYKHLHAQHKSILPDQGEDEYLCVVCDFRTGSKKNLLVHMRKHNVQDQNPPSHVYSCVLCRYMNPKRRNLFQHMKKKHNIEIVMRDDGSTSCFLTDSSSTVADKDDSVQNILTVGDIVTTTTDDSQLQIVMDACEKNAVQVQNVINIEDIANCVSNPQPNNSNIIILEQNQSNTVVQHEAAEAIEGLQALAEQPGIVESQEVITDSDSQTVTVEEVQTSKSLEEDMETEIVTMETEILKSFQPENVPEIKKDKETDIQLSEDQLMNLSTGDFVEINGEMYKVEISAEDGNNAENVVQGEIAQTQVQAAEEQHVAVSDENAFQEFVQMMTECTDDTNTTTMDNATAENSEMLTESQETALHIITSDASVNDCASHVVTTSDHDNLTVLAEITNAASVGDSSEYITIQGSTSVATDVTEPSNVMTVANSTSVDEGSVGVFETQ